ncbi:hypothetical protein FB45DRAFT_1054136 [Roridomyces roridus]|uniref:DUF7330 domain-containing protein n=1 Tax=Roridomyces roridus TaxID=1738132 RepID=A0AAD7C829_9AGAR|nr:hypothetical protein FB45DRAFT_1054136 [Roridomyces roridus]
MILTEDDSPRSAVKDTTPLLRVEDTASSPPAYTDAAGPSHQPDHHVVRSTRSFRRVFLVAFGLWVSSFLLLGSVLFSIGVIGSRWRSYPSIPGVALDCMQPSGEAEKKNPIAAPFPYSVAFEYGIPLPPESLDAGNSSDTKNVTIKTSNDNLQSSIHLTTASNNNGSFRVEQRTSNGQLMAKILTLPVDATLDVTATTSNAPVDLHLPSTYEGDINVAGGSISARRVDSSEQDPAGKDRTRTFQTWMVRLTRMALSVFWERGNMHRGRAAVETTNGQASVYI